MEVDPCDDARRHTCCVPSCGVLPFLGGPSAEPRGCNDDARVVGRHPRGIRHRICGEWANSAHAANAKLAEGSRAAQLGGDTSDL